MEKVKNINKSYFFFIKVPNSHIRDVQSSQKLSQLSEKDDIIFPNTSLSKLKCHLITKYP